MPARHHLSWLVVAAGVAAVLAGAVWWRTAPEPDAAVPAAAAGPPSASTASLVDARGAADARRGAPRGVRVPTLGVSAPVDAVRAAAGTLVPPADPARVGWWSGGARPGSARGSVLLVGHSVRNGSGALDRLSELRRGDAVLVRTDGSVFRYAVDTVRVHRRGSVAREAERLFGRRGPARLVLVTCAEWDGERYLSNVVVTARPSG